uniref:Homogentisate phytyltransferase n=1 Tax=Oryza glumipatula TaxID=40148 RepID=A0A0E0ACR9_9ORYZ
MDSLRLRPSLLAARAPGAASLPPLRREMVNGQFLCPAKGPKVLPSINVRNSLVGNPPTTGYHIDQQLVPLTLRDNLYNLQLKHMIHQALSIVSVSLLAVENLSDVSPLFLTGLLEAVVAALFMNIYIVGLNQLFDIEIDKVNKPTLPLASGEYSPATGVALVSAFAAMSFGLGWAVGSQPLFLALFISFILGTAYSINTFVFRRPAVFTRPLIFATAFMTFFSVVIALFKDIPDIEGDRIFGIKSFSVRLGQKKVFWICVGLLEMAYCVAILMGATSACLWSKYATVVGHAILAAILWNRSRSIDLTSKTAITSFYMFIWKGRR